MKFRVTSKNGKTKIINATDLDNAEEICNVKAKKWTDIIYLDSIHDFSKEK